MKQPNRTLSRARQRAHGVIHEHSVRTVGMHPTLAREVIREERDLEYPLRTSSLEPPVCRVCIAAKSIGTLTNGLGANWSPHFQGEEAYPLELPASKRWPGYSMTESIERYLKPALAAAKRLGKTLSLTEAGAMYFNDDPRTARNTRHDAFLTMAEQIVRAVNLGVAGVMVWSYVNAGRTDGQWGWIGTREKRFAPVPNLLNGFAALMRYQQVGAEIRPCTVTSSDFSSFISAGALFAPGAGETIWLVNDHPVERIRVTLALPPNRSRKPFILYRKDFAPELQEVAQLDDGDELTLVLPGMSFNTLTTLADNHRTRHEAGTKEKLSFRACEESQISGPGGFQTPS